MHTTVTFDLSQWMSTKVVLSRGARVGVRHAHRAARLSDSVLRIDRLPSWDYNTLSQISRCMLSRPVVDHHPCAAWSELNGRANWLKPCKQGNYPPAI